MNGYRGGRNALKLVGLLPYAAGGQVAKELPLEALLDGKVNGADKLLQFWIVARVECQINLPVAIRGDVGCTEPISTLRGVRPWRGRAHTCFGWAVGSVVGSRFPICGQGFGHQQGYVVPLQSR